MAEPANTDLAAADGRIEHVLVCKGCKFGCVLTVALDERGDIASLKGNTCDRGVEYAERKVAAGTLDEPAKGEDEAGKPTSTPVVGYREFRRRHRQNKAQTGKSQGA